MWFEGPIEVIPAVDVLGDEAVRLHQGDYDAVVERATDPVALARRWADAGARRIHLVDLDGARSGRVRPELVQQVAAVGLPVQASGGIRSLEDAQALLEAGADRVVVGTAAWPDPTPWFAARRGARARARRARRPGAGRGLDRAAGISLDDALEQVADRRVLVTAIDRDGTLAGPDLGLTAAAVAAGARVLAAGGVRSPADVPLSPPPAPRPRSSAAPCSLNPTFPFAICPTDC